jgi:hypothetical protein
MMDVSRFDAAPLIAFIAVKETKRALCAIGSSNNGDAFFASQKL